MTRAAIIMTNVGTTDASFRAETQRQQRMPITCSYRETEAAISSRYMHWDTGGTTYKTA